MTQEALDLLARGFLAAVDRASAFADYNRAIDFVRRDDEGNDAWRLILNAVEKAKDRRDLEAIGAALIEELLLRAGAALIEQVERQIHSDARFAAAAAVANMSGVPRDVWSRVNRALLNAGISAERLVEWSTFSVPPPDARPNGS